jgi:4'-phosphopantetheinyl transferase EntD
MIERLLPAGVMGVEAFGDPVDHGPVYDQECVPGGWGLQRRTEFATVRTLARRGLVHLGEPPTAIPRGEQGAPMWPPGVVGSMTHCPGYRSAAVARAEDMLTLGVDAEPHLPLPRGVLAVISLSSERTQLSRLAAHHPSLHWDRLLFSAKEAVYKAWFPLTGGWLGFDEAHVTLNPDGTFLAELLGPDRRDGDCSVGRFFGRWLLECDLLVTAIASASGSDPSPLFATSPATSTCTTTIWA